MTTDVTKKKSAVSSQSDKSPAQRKTERDIPSSLVGKKQVDHRVSGYSRVKSGELKRRSVSRAPDMSNPSARVANPNVEIGSLVSVKKKNPPIASVHVEPKTKTINDARKTAFPFTIVFLSLICSILFMYMIFNYVQIHQWTSDISDLKSEIQSLSAEKDNLNSKLEIKNDLSYIEKVAREELGMVKADEISKKYIVMDPDDEIKAYSDFSTDSSAD